MAGCQRVPLADIQAKVTQVHSPRLPDIALLASPSSARVTTRVEPLPFLAPRQPKICALPPHPSGRFCGSRSPPRRGGALPHTQILFLAMAAPARAVHTQFSPRRRLLSSSVNISDSQILTNRPPMELPAQCHPSPQHYFDGTGNLHSAPPSPRGNPVAHHFQDESSRRTPFSSKDRGLDGSNLSSQPRESQSRLRPLVRGCWPSG